MADCIVHSMHNYLSAPVKICNPLFAKSVSLHQDAAHTAPSGVLGLIDVAATTQAATTSVIQEFHEYPQIES
jgi:hypothetical protein